MAQRFPGTVPNQGPSGSPQQRYPPPQTPGMRQYPVQNFPAVSILFVEKIARDGQNILLARRIVDRFIYLFFMRHFGFSVLGGQVTGFVEFQQRTGYTPPPAMATSGGTMIARPAQPPYSPMRGGPMPPQQSVKRPADSRPGIQQKR